MPETVECARCGQSAEPMPRPPMPGPAGQEIQQRICPDCWEEWQRMEVMVINELRLNFMDPEANEVLTRHMRGFLFAEDPQGAAAP